MDPSPTSTTLRARYLRTLAGLATVLAIGVAGLVLPSNDGTRESRPKLSANAGATVAPESAFGRVERSVEESRLRVAIAEQEFPQLSPAAVADRPSAERPPVAEPVRPTRDLSVVVESALGIRQPSIPIGFTILDASGEVRRSWRIGSTGSDGSPLLVTDVETVLAEVGDGSALFLEVDSMLRSVARRKIESGPPVQEEIRLSLPPTGGVQVALAGTRGPITSDAFVMLLPTDEREAERFGGESRANDRGRVVFEHVPLGIRFKLMAHSRSDPFPQLEIDGPTQDGEIVEAELVVDDARRIRGRLVDSTRHSLPSHSGMVLRITPFDATKQGRLLAPRLEADGSFDFTWTELGDTGPVELRFQLHSRERRFRERRVALPWPIPLGITDLGEIVCDEFPFLAAGRVIDRNGDPIEGATVRCIVGDGALEAETSTGTGVDGRFTLYADPPREPFALRAGRHAYTPSPRVEVAVGATDVVLELGFTGRLHGSLVPPPNAEPAHFEIAYVSSEGERFIGKIAADWTFAIDWLHEGRGQVEIRGAPETPLRILDDLASIPGEPKHDARLDGIILTTVARTVEIRAHDREGTPLTEFEVQIGCGDDGFDYCPRVTESGSGKRRLVLPIVGADLRLGVDAQAANVLRGVVEDLDVLVVLPVVEAR